MGSIKSDKNCEDIILTNGMSSISGELNRMLKELQTVSGICSMALLVANIGDERLIGAQEFDFHDPDFIGATFNLDQFPQIQKSILAEYPIQISCAEFLPSPLNLHFHSTVAIIPVSLHEDIFGIVVAQLGDDPSSKSEEWRQNVLELIPHIAIAVQALRLATAYQDESIRRQYMREIASDILQGVPFNEIASRICDIVSCRLNVDRVILYLINREQSKQLVTPVAVKNISMEYARIIAKFHSDVPSRIESLASSIPQIKHKVQNDPHYSDEIHELMRQENIQTILLANLKQGDQFTGILAVYPRSGRTFSPVSVASLQGFADMAAIAVAVSRQVEQLKDLATIRERNRLAREIHDTVAQSLSALCLKLETVQTLLVQQDNERAIKMLDAVQLQAKEALRDTRRAVQDLSAEALQSLSISQAIEAELNRIQAEGQFITNLNITGSERILPPDLSSTLLRIAQEAINNALKHSHAKRVRVGLQFGANEIVMLIEDDGVGFDTTVQSTADLEGGYGIYSMQERATLYGGTFQIESTIGWGTRIKVSLPIKDDELAQTVSSDLVVQLPDFDGKKLRILLADDHPSVRSGMRLLLETDPSIEIVSEARNGEEAYELAKASMPDVILMDVNMPGIGGIKALEMIHEELPSIPVVMLSAEADENDITNALKAGAHGFLLKNIEGAELLKSVHAAVGKDAVLSPQISNILAEKVAGQNTENSQRLSLNDREREILELAAFGASNKQIAAELFIAPKTVEHYLHSIYTKLDVHSRGAAVRLGIQMGLISPIPMK